MVKVSDMELGMRVVVIDGPWKNSRIGGRVGGHYGKVVEIGHPICEQYVRVDITGHVDGGPPDLQFDWFYDAELKVVD